MSDLAAAIHESFINMRLAIGDTNSMLDELDRVWSAANKRDADTDAAVKRIQQQAKKTA